MGVKQRNESMEFGGKITGRVFHVISGLRTALFVAISVYHATSRIVEDSLVTIVVPDVSCSP